MATDACESTKISPTVVRPVLTKEPPHIRF